jgi:septum site-determining protein MinD
MNNQRTIINVVSGKGGTGKTLLTSVLADMLGNSGESEVLVIDLDVFVRGLTSLLYFYRSEKLHITNKGELSVSDIFVKKVSYAPSISEKLGISKYRSFEVFPAVSKINEILNFQDIVPNTRKEAKAIVSFILESIPKKYRFVILDSRAGYDELVAATHELSDVSICVEEQDSISRVTSDNLIAQLNANSDTPLFRLVNKGRGINSVEDLETTISSVTDLGIIPFDMDVLNSFGAKTFWDEISHSLYRAALARAWNRLSDKLELGIKLSTPRVSPIGNEKFESRFGMLGIKDRIFLLYGIMLSSLGFGYGLFGSELLNILERDPIRTASLLAGVIGVGLSFYVFLKGPKK